MIINMDELSDDDPLKKAVKQIFGDELPKGDSLKYDQGKLRLDLIPTSAIRSIGAVLTHGAQKYADNTWQQVERERYVAALLRHLVDYMDDPNGVDADSGLKHIEHVLCNAVFLNHFAAKGSK